VTRLEVVAVRPLAAAVALACALVPAGAPPAHAQGAGIQLPDARRPSAIVIAGRGRADEPSRLPLADEQLVERARTLLRGGQPVQADRIVADLERRHPDDLDVLLARAELLNRLETPPATAKWLDEQAKRSPVAKALREQPFRAGFWARFAAESYAGAGRVADARARALVAWERSPEQGGWARARLEQWSIESGPEGAEALGRDYAKLADRNPARVDLVLEAARVEALAGRVRPALDRVRRAEAKPDSTAAPGSLLWQLALSLRARGAVAERAADSALVVLARGEAFDPALRERAVARLFEDRQQADAFPPAEGWVEGALRFMRVDGEGRVETGRAAVEPGDERARLLGLEQVWRGLPAGPDHVRRGLELADRLVAAGETAAGRKLARDATALAGRVPGAAGDPEVSGRLALERGENAFQAGDLAAAARMFDEVAASDASERLREAAAFEACEARFFAGEFDSAAARYDAFARAWPGSPHANDALERAYLIEGGGDGPPAGLAELAAASLAARAGKPADALRHAEAAEQAAAGGPAWSHAGLLVAALYEGDGRLADAAAKARAVAETRPDDRLAPTARRKAGDLLLAAGDPVAALGQYEELLVRYPRSWLAPETRRRVQELRARQGGTP
jgi:hypothetical protein